MPPLHTLLLLSLIALASCFADSADRPPLDAEAEGPATTSRLEGDLTSSVDSAIGLYRKARLDDAASLLTSVLAEADARGDAVEAARALTWLGSVGWKRGDYETAWRDALESLRRKEEAGLDDQIWRSHNVLGLVAWYQGRLGEAFERFRLAETTAGAVGETLGASVAVGNRGNIHDELGELEEARSAFLFQRDVARSFDSIRIEANALTNLGRLEVTLGNPVAAVKALKEVLVIHRAVDNVDGIQNTLAQLGSAYAALGEMGRAHALYDSATALAREHGMRAEEVLNLEVLAELYHLIGDSRRALRLFDRASELNRELGQDLELGADLRAQAQLLSALGRTDAARLRIEDAISLHEALGARLEIVRDRMTLAEVEQIDGDDGAAREQLDEAASLATVLGVPRLALDIAMARARVAERANRPREALTALSTASQLARDEDYVTRWEIDAVSSRAYRDTSRPDSALAAGKRALAAMERVRRTFGSGVLRVAYAQARRESYGDLVALYLDSGDSQAAFGVADAARARTLQAGLPLSEAADPAESVSGLAEGERLLRQIDNVIELASLEYTQTAEHQDAFRVRLAALREEYESHLVRAAEAGGRDVGLLGETGLNLAAVQEALRPEEVLLEYMVTSERLLVFVLRHDSLAVAQYEIASADLVTKTRLARGLVASKGEPDGRRILGELYGILIEPAVRTGLLEGALRLVVVPHGVLTYLPFGALMDRASGTYLVEDFEIMASTSAGALVELRSEQRATGLRVQSIATFAPFPEGLPASVEEVEAIGRLRREVRSMVGREATEKRVRRALGEVETVHLATHGILNAGNPMFSRVELARGSTDSSSDDGRLEVHELLSIDIRSSLIVLSACDTGSGAAWSTAYNQGDDYTTLAQAFLFAGADNVVATLWPVDDRGAARFQEALYRGLRTEAPSTALAMAQREMIRSPSLSDPFYWAAFRITGSGEWAADR